MNRPAVIRIVLAVCALMIVGVMAWATRKTLALEQKQAAAAAAAELEERIRLSLARVDTAAAGLLVIENQRPPHHFQAFYEPEDVYTSKLQVVGKGIVVQPSPLLGAAPRFVRLHFEVREDGSICSPQVPTGNERDLAEQSGLPRAVLDGAARELGTLRTLLGKPAPGGSGRTNRELFCRAPEAPETAAWSNPPPAQVQKKEASVASRRLSGQGAARQSWEYQHDLSYLEKSRRASDYNDALEQAVANSVANLAQQEGAPQPAGEAADHAAAPPAAVSGPPVALGTAVTPFRPLWLGGELFAVRRVSVGGRERHQGVWFRSGELGRHLVEGVGDLLPQARLERIEEVSAASLGGVFEPQLAELSEDRLSLVTFPWRLLPGESPAAGHMDWQVLRTPLAVGWAALLLALLAAGILVRGVMKLSERRAAFVSSVTHEMRTPLTTFHLYSDMLAEGMVRDEEQQRSYLDTMRREAVRLNHLIENVLAYSRIERGSARTQRECVTLGDLVERLRPRLEERTRRDRAELEVEANEEDRGVKVVTDLTAVEQIIFNLVDNACKYGLPDEGRRVVRLRALNGSRRACLEVCDEGGGVDRRNLKRLFRPFHKSADDAAHSKPGVGLGLALCRRLARVLGGELRVDARRDHGACFVLELPSDNQRDGGSDF